MFELDVWGEMEKFYQDQIIYKRQNMMTGDPAEKSVLSASIDWKEMRYQRKMKVRELKKNKGGDRTMVQRDDVLK